MENLLNQTKDFLALKEQSEINLLTLKENSCPGDGIIVGIDKEGKGLIQIYWIMRKGGHNKMFFVMEKGKLIVVEENPNSVIYTAMTGKRFYKVRNEEGKIIDSVLFVVSNGNQTVNTLNKEGLENFIVKEKCEYNLTQEIIAVSKKCGSDPLVTEMSKASLGNERKRISFQPKLYPGFGYCITNSSLSPCILPLNEIGVENIADLIWDSLNIEDRMALAIKSINIEEGIYSHKIINRFNPVN